MQGVGFRYTLQYTTFRQSPKLNTYTIFFYYYIKLKTHLTNPYNKIDKYSYRRLLQRQAKTYSKPPTKL